MYKTNLYTVSVKAAQERCYALISFVRFVHTLAVFYTPANEKEYISKLDACRKQLLSNIITRRGELVTHIQHVLRETWPDEDPDVLRAFTTGEVDEFEAQCRVLVTGFSTRPLHAAIGKRTMMDFMNTWEHSEAFKAAVPVREWMSAERTLVFGKTASTLIRFIAPFNYPTETKEDILAYRLSFTESLCAILPPEHILQGLAGYASVYEQETTAIKTVLADRQGIPKAPPPNAMETIQALMSEVKALTERVAALENHQAVSPP